MSVDSLAYVSLGSNIKPEANLRDAAAMLSGCCQLLAVSHVWQSEPVGCLRQPPFLNAAVLIRTDQPPVPFRSVILRAIERSLGRMRAADEKNAPRTIDLDLALYGSLTMRAGSLQVPDPATLEHAFVAVPLAELDPEQVHPTAGRTLGEIALTMLRKRPQLWLRSDLQLLPQCTPKGELIELLANEMIELKLQCQPELLEHLPE